MHEQVVPTIVDDRTSLDIVRSGERARRWEFIPLVNVITETPVIDPAHASELAADIAQSQQLLPILVRAHETNRGDLAFQIADGFHRSAGMKAAGMEKIEAIVMYGWSHEELLNKRILSANSVKSVKFGRLALWMNELFELTPWSENGVALSDAVTATVFNSEEIEGKVNRREMQQLREWVRTQARNWQMPVDEMWSSLGIIEQSDPRLVHLVRPEISKGDEHTFILEGHLKAVSEAFPGKDNFPIQRALINWSLQAGGSTQQVERMAESIESYVTPGMKAREAAEVIAGIDRAWANERAQKTAERERAKKVALRREDSFEDDGVTRQSGRTGERPAKITKDQQLQNRLTEIKGLKWWERTSGLEERQADIVRLVLGEEVKLSDIEERFNACRDEVGNMILDALEKRDNTQNL